MDRARRHQRFLARLALVLLALVAELLGRSLSHRLDVGRHVAAPSYSGADYYPILLAVVKVSVALMLDRKSGRVGKECRSRWSPYHYKKKEYECKYVRRTR